MACCQSYSPNYFAITDILSTEERISCKIEVELPGLGNLIYFSIVFACDLRITCCYMLYCIQCLIERMYNVTDDINVL